MTLAEIQKSLKELSRSEKVQLVQQLVTELARDEKELSQYFDPHEEHANWSQHAAHETAAKLQEFLDQQRSTTPA